MYPSLRKSLHERIKPEEKGSAGSALFSINLIFSITTWAKVNTGEKRKIENVSWLFLSPGDVSSLKKILLFTLTRD